MKRVKLHERLARQGAVLGFLQSQPNLALTEMASICGYDFVFLDAEHGVFNDNDLLHAIQVLGGTHTLAMVRLAGQAPQALGRYMDMGADGIVVPNVSGLQQAQALVQAMHYPPLGTRGVGAALHRSTRYGLDWGSHVKEPRAGVSLLVIIESQLGVSNVEEILAVEGVDGAIIGASDLTADLGAAGDFSLPAFQQAVAQIEGAAAGQGKIVGSVPRADSEIRSLMQRGHGLFILAADMPLIREAMDAPVRKARAHLLEKS